MVNTKRAQPKKELTHKSRIVMRIATAAQERADAATERVAFGPEDAPTETTALAVLSKAPTTLKVDGAGKVVGTRVSGQGHKRDRKRFSSLNVKNTYQVQTYAKRMEARENRDRMKAEEAKLKEMHAGLREAERRRQKQKAEAREARLKKMYEASGQRITNALTLRKLTPKQLGRLHKM